MYARGCQCFSHRPLLQRISLTVMKSAMLRYSVSLRQMDCHYFHFWRSYGNIQSHSKNIIKLTWRKLHIKNRPFTFINTIKLMRIVTGISEISLESFVETLFILQQVSCFSYRATYIIDSGVSFQKFGNHCVSWTYLSSPCIGAKIYSDRSRYPNTTAPGTKYHCTNI